MKAAKEMAAWRGKPGTDLLAIPSGVQIPPTEKAVFPQFTQPSPSSGEEKTHAEAYLGEIVGA